MRYSATTNGFYAKDIDYAALPSDCVDVTQSDYDDIFDKLSKGMILAHDANGYPKAINAPVIPNTKEQNQVIALKLLSETDFVEIPSVVSAESNPRLLNKADFVDYRNQVRIFAVYPVDGDVIWPVKPTEQWSDPFEGVGK